MLIPSLLATCKTESSKFMYFTQTPTWSGLRPSFRHWGLPGAQARAVANVSQMPQGSFQPLPTRTQLIRQAPACVSPGAPQSTPPMRQSRDQSCCTLEVLHLGPKGPLPPAEEGRLGSMYPAVHRSGEAAPSLGELNRCRAPVGFPTLMNSLPNYTCTSFPPPTRQGRVLNFDL